MTILELIPPATVKKLIARGLLSPKADPARAEITEEFGRIERALTRLECEKRELSLRELRGLLETYPGRQPAGTRLRRALGRWHQDTHLP